MRRLLFRLLNIPVQAILVVARVMQHTRLFPSFWRAMIGSTQIGRASREYRLGNLEESFGIYKALADHAISGASLHERAVIGTAAYFTGYMYAAGEGVQQNQHVAEEYLRKAADLDYPDAVNYFSDKNSST